MKLQRYIYISLNTIKYLHSQIGGILCRQLPELMVNLGVMSIEFNITLSLTREIVVEIVEDSVKFVTSQFTLEMVSPHFKSKINNIKFPAIPSTRINVQFNLYFVTGLEIQITTGEVTTSQDWKLTL